MDERLVAVEQPMPPGEQITLQPTLALVLAEHLHYPAIGRKEFIVLDRLSFPLPIGNLKNGVQSIGERFIGTKNPEVPLVLVKLNHVAQEFSEHVGIGCLNNTG